MLPRNDPDRIQITFDDHRLVANAALILPTTLARHLGLPQLVQRRLDLGNAPGRANTSDKMMTLIASALAGGDCIDDADVLRTGGTALTLGGTVKAPSTLGTFLRSFRWGHCPSVGSGGEPGAGRLGPAQRRRFFSLAGRLARSARRFTLHLPQHWPWETQFSRALARFRAIPFPA